MIQPRNDGMAVANVTQLASDLGRALDGQGFGPVSADAIDDRGPKPVTVRTALTVLHDRIEAYLKQRPEGTS